MKGLVVFFAALNLAKLGFAAEPGCEFELLPGAGIRRAVIQASENYRRAFPDFRVSTFRGNEFQVLKPLDNPSAHVFYLASGADIYRPFVDFPTAGNIHLLDWWTGWGFSPAHALLSVRHRLGMLGENITVRRLGFLEQMPSWDDKDFVDGPSDACLLEHSCKLDTWRADDPAILDFWIRDAESNALVKKTLWIHAFDWTKSPNYDSVLKMVPPNEPLEGVLLAGLSGTPFANDWWKLLSRLDPQGWYVQEMSDPTLAPGELFEFFSDFLQDTRLEVRATTPYRLENQKEFIVMLMRKKRQQAEPTSLNSSE